MCALAGNRSGQNGNDKHLLPVERVRPALPEKEPLCAVLGLILLVAKHKPPGAVRGCLSHLSVSFDVGDESLFLVSFLKIATVSPEPFYRRKTVGA